MDTSIINILESFTAKKFNLLLIEDHEIMRKALSESLQSVFLKAKITVMDENAWQELEDFFDSSHYDMVVVSTNLKWRQPGTLTNYGTNIIAYIREKQKNLFIMSISMDPATVQYSILKGADIGIQKDEIYKLKELLRGTILGNTICY